MSDCTALPPFQAVDHDLKVTPGLPGELLEIPNNPHLTNADIDYIAGCIKASA